MELPYISFVWNPKTDLPRGIAFPEHMKAIFYLLSLLLLASILLAFPTIF